MPTIAEFIIEGLQQRGVKSIFGVPGDYSGSFFKKLYKSSLDVVPTTTELAAGIAADAYARVNGLGCFCVTYCVGGFRSLDAVAGAFAEKSPVVIISGSPGIKERSSKMLLHHMVGHFECQHDMFSEITCANTVLRDPERAGYEIDRVLNAALYHKQPVYIELPRDMVDKQVRYDVLGGVPKDNESNSYSLQEAIKEVSDWINSSKQPVIWAGVDVARYGFGQELIKFAQKANIPIVTTILGKGCVDERNPIVRGVYCESTASPEIKSLVDKCDCLIMLGVMMTDVNCGFLPVKCQRQNIILSSADGVQVKNHSYQDVSFVDFMNSLLKLKLTRNETHQPVKAKETTWQVTEPTKKLTIARLFEKVASIMNDKMALVADIGESLFGSLNIPVAHNMFLSDAFYASMGWAIPAALGLQMAKPGIRPIVLVGDGSTQMTGMEFSTMVRLKKNPIVIVLNNGGYSTEKMIFTAPCNEIQNWNYEKIPLIVGGGIGFKVTTESELEDAFNAALVATEPAILNCVIDPNDHTPELKRMFGRSLREGA